MNVGLCMPQPGFMQGLREIATKNGALLIFDEVKTGAKLGWGGASEYFGVNPDMITLAKSIGGGGPPGGGWGSRGGADPALQHQAIPNHNQQQNPPFVFCGVCA